MKPSNALRLRGGLTLSRWLHRVLGDYAEPVTAESAPDVRVSFSGFDRYWMRVFFRGDFYEPELHRLFSRMTRLRDFHLIDGGANIGFWSAVLTSSHFGITRAVAVEPSPTTYSDLARTAALCGGRFATEHRALSSQPGAVVFDQGRRHESRHIVTEENAGAATIEPVDVVATTIDDLVAKYELDASNLMVKLDVEGAELDCVTGGRNAFAHGAIFIYEEHGKEPQSLLTKQLLERGGLCWFIDDDGMLLPVQEASAASRFKTEPKRGYNFLCTSRSYAGEHSLERRLFG